MDNKKAYYIEGFDEEKATREAGPIFGRFYKSYATKPQELGIQEWLFARLKEELPNREDSYIERVSNDIVDGVRNFDEDLKSLDASCETGPKNNGSLIALNNLHQVWIEMSMAIILQR